MNRHGQRPPDEVVSFAEYERLYRHRGATLRSDG